MDMLIAVAASSGQATPSLTRRLSKGLSLMAKQAETSQSTSVAPAEGAGSTASIGTRDGGDTVDAKPKTETSTATTIVPSSNVGAAAAAPQTNSPSISLATLLGSAGAQGSSSSSLGLLNRFAQQQQQQTSPSVLPPPASVESHEVKQVPTESNGVVMNDKTTTDAVTPSVAKADSATTNDIIGIRPPRNPLRKGSSDSSEGRPRLYYHSEDLYRQFCALYEVHPNSRVVRILQQHDAHTTMPENPLQELTSLDISLCMIRDKGMLPLLELLRLCTNLQSLNLSGNDLSNEGLEYLAHAIMEGLPTSSFEVNDDDGTTNTSSSSSSKVSERITKTGETFMNIDSHFGSKIASLDVSNNRISLGGVRLLQLIAERLPSLIEVNAADARVDRLEIEELNMILAANAQCG